MPKRLLDDDERRGLRASMVARERPTVIIVDDLEKPLTEDPARLRELAQRLDEPITLHTDHWFHKEDLEAFLKEIGPVAKRFNQRAARHGKSERVARFAELYGGPRPTIAPKPKPPADPRQNRKQRRKAAKLARRKNRR